MSIPIPLYEFTESTNGLKKLPVFPYPIFKNKSRLVNLLHLSPEKGYSNVTYQ